MNRVLILVAVSVLCAYPIAVMAAPPLTTDDPFPMDPGRIALWETYSSSHSEHEALTYFTLGVYPRFDIGFCVGQAGEGEGQSTDPAIAVKWLAFGEDADGPAGAVSFGCVTKPHLDDKEVGNNSDFAVNFVYQHPVRFGMMFANLGYTWAGDTGCVDCINFNIALKHEVSSSVSFVGEFVDSLGTKETEGTPRSVREFLVGGVYTGKTGPAYSMGAAYSPDNPESPWRLTSGLAIEF